MVARMIKTKNNNKSRAKSKIIPDREGSLIVVEGVDGSGKSTQLRLLARWLESNGFAVLTTEWNSSPTIRPLIKKIKNKNQPILVSPYVFSLLHAADLAERVKFIIEGALNSGIIVLSDRYIYTGYARDAARGLDQKWLNELFSFAPKPDLTFYFKVSPKIAISRKVTMPKFYEAGMDIGLSDNPKRAFDIFQNRILKEYEKMAKKENFIVMNGDNRIYNTFSKVKEKTIEFIKEKYNITLH